MKGSRSNELGHTISIDACHWKRNRDGRKAIIVNILDEASRFHVARVLEEGDELGNLTVMDNIEAIPLKRVVSNGTRCGRELEEK